MPYYDYALDLILDVESPNDDMLTEEQHEMVESAAEMLYGLIHVRFILTTRGMSKMLEKFKNVDFGRCPRVFCSGQNCLPVGQSDVPRTSTVKIFCPKCEDIYYPRSKYQGNIDGACFGTTFPHLFLMTYGATIKPKKPAQCYVPRIFGFKIHHVSGGGKGGSSSGGGQGECRASGDASGGASGGASGARLRGWLRGCAAARRLRNRERARCFDCS